MRAAIAFAVMAAATAQETTDASRDIWDTGFRGKRPAAASPARTRATAPTYRLAPQPKAVQDPAPAKLSPVIGITLWRLERSRGVDGNTPRLLVPDDSGATAEYTPERIGVDTPLRVGDRVRLGIESPREAYLYVIDRERFRDGSFGDAYLIFPALRFNRGDNRVVPGRLIEIPAQTDHVKALRITRQDPRHVGEELLIVAAPKPIETLRPGEQNARVPPDILQTLESAIPSETVRLDLAGDLRSWTPPEKTAGAGERLLTPDDPMPQSIYAARAAAAPGNLVRVRLEVQ